MLGASGACSRGRALCRLLRTCNWPELRIYTSPSCGTRRRIASTAGMHGISFETAARIFEDPNFVSYRRAGRHSAASEEQHGEEEIRIIPARKASAGERALYHSRQ